MAHKDVERILNLVRERTGYPVAVSSKDDLTTHASLRPASKALPGHVVFLNPKYESIGNYLVAVQCAMLLAWWTDNFPDFAV